MTFSHDEKLNEIATRVAAGERLSFEDGVVLYVTTDLPALGKLADSERRRRHGRTTSIAISTPPTFVMPTASFAVSSARHVSQTLTHTTSTTV
jgi:2-iminoacetate synthase ThiH